VCRSKHAEASLKAIHWRLNSKQVEPSLKAIHWRLNIFLVAHCSSSGALTVFAASGLHMHVVTGHSQVWLDYGRSPHAYVNQRLQIQLELLMMSGVLLETCWAFSERWIKKFYYKVASCWLFLLSHTTMHGSMNIKKKWCMVVLHLTELEKSAEGMTDGGLSTGGGKRFTLHTGLGALLVSFTMHTWSLSWM